MCHLPRHRGWLSALLLTALFALIAAAPAAFADNPITLHHVTFSGNVHDIVPGAIAAGLSDALFWWSLGLSLVIAFVVTVPVNRWLIARGKGHAVMHEFHQH